MPKAKTKVKFPSKDVLKEFSINYRTAQLDLANNGKASRINSKSLALKSGLTNGQYELVLGSIGGACNLPEYVNRFRTMEELQGFERMMRIVTDEFEKKKSDMSGNDLAKIYVELRKLELGTPNQPQQNLQVNVNQQNTNSESIDDYLANRMKVIHDGKK